MVARTRRHVHGRTRPARVRADGRPVPARFDAARRGAARQTLTFTLPDRASATSISIDADDASGGQLERRVQAIGFGRRRDPHVELAGLDDRLVVEANETEI